MIGASRLGKVAGVKGDGTVARITFRAVAAGTSELGFEGKALDASLRPVAVRTRPAVVEVGGSNSGRSPGRAEAGSIADRQALRYQEAEKTMFSRRPDYVAAAKPASPWPSWSWWPPSWRSWRR